ncbi:hypothetical protein CEN39_13950, partial [Fischerella thermalis CCMEE 5201]
CQRRGEVISMNATRYQIAFAKLLSLKLFLLVQFQGYAYLPNGSLGDASILYKQLLLSDTVE